VFFPGCITLRREINRIRRWKITSKFYSIIFRRNNFNNIVKKNRLAKNLLKNQQTVKWESNFCINRSLFSSGQGKLIQALNHYLQWKRSRDLKTKEKIWIKKNKTYIEVEWMKTLSFFLFPAWKIVSISSSNPQYLKSKNKQYFFHPLIFDNRQSQIFTKFIICFEGKKWLFSDIATKMFQRIFEI
jgi:hypothetical protein